MKNKLKLTNLSKKEMGKLLGGQVNCTSCNCNSCECKLYLMSFENYATYDSQYESAKIRSGI